MHARGAHRDQVSELQEETSSTATLIVTFFSHRRTSITSVKCVRKGALAFGGESDRGNVARLVAGCGGAARGCLRRGQDWPCGCDGGAIALGSRTLGRARIGAGVHRHVSLPQR